MISQLRGALVEATASSCVVDCGGVGYEAGVSGATAARLPAPGEQVMLYTRLVVREDAMTLYGFGSRAEREVFDRLVAISGVGPRLALAVLSRLAPEELFRAVTGEDVRAVCAVPGVGKKTAQRIILELKGVFSREGAPGGAAPAPGQQRMPEPADATSEAADALLSMGFTSAEAELALKGLDGSEPVEKLLSAALRRLGAGR